MLKKLKLFLLLIMISFLGNKVSANYDKLAYDFKFKDLDGSTLNLSEYKGKVVVVVNVASQCGFTNQYEDMQKVWEKYQVKGIVMLGVPSNDFGKQEPGSNEEIQNFCTDRFGVTFPIMDKIDVNGDDAHPLYQFLKSQKPGLLGSEAIKWNFTKFLVNKNGEVVDRFAPQTAPEKLVEDIEKIL